MMFPIVYDGCALIVLSVAVFVDSAVSEPSLHNGLTSALQANEPSTGEMEVVQNSFWFVFHVICRR